MADGSAAREIERAITQALAKKGVGGAVVVRDDHCELHTGSTPIAIELGDWVAQWNLLPDEVKDKRAEKAATRLTNAYRQSQGQAVRLPAAERIARLKRLATYAGVLLAVGLAAIWLHRAGFFGQKGGGADTTATAAPGPSTAGSVDEVADETARVERACDGARQRIYQGATLGVDTAGFVVELWLARDSAGLVDDDQLVALVERGVAEEIGVAGPGQLSVHPGGDELGLATAVIRFEGGYVAPFFTPKGREQFYAVAEQFADAGGAMHAALFARCAHLPTTRDIGAWYRGIDERGAIVSMLFAAGHFADPPAFDAKSLADGGLLRNLRRAVGTLDDTVRDEVLRLRGGRSHRHATQDGRSAFSLRFPLGGPTRPALASRDLAKTLEL